MNTTIRKATIEDLGSISKLNKELFEYEIKYGDEYSQDWTYSEGAQSYFKRRIESERGIVLVAEVDGEVVGYMLSFIADYSYRLPATIAEIENTFIREEFRGKRIGKKLAEETKRIAKEKGAKRLKVIATLKNTRGIEFYHSIGLKDFDLTLEMNL